MSHSHQNIPCQHIQKIPHREQDLGNNSSHNIDCSREVTSNQISVHISLIKDGLESPDLTEDVDMEEVSDTYSENSESDVPHSPTNIIPSIDQLFKRSFSHELEELTKTANGEQIMALDDIHQILRDLKEAENLDVYM